MCDEIQYRDKIADLSSIIEPKRYYVKQKYNKFLDILFDLVNDKATDHIVRWNDEDQDSGFMITEPREFEKQILPQYFKQSNMDSFIRQLNIYDFNKKKKR